MKKSAPLLLLAMLGAALPFSALADNGHGHGHGKHHKHKEVYWDGPCKVEREYKKHGRVKEKRECRPDVVYMQPQVVHPVVMQPAPVIVQPQSGVVIQATGAMRLP
jgi:hypothetical protein